MRALAWTLVGTLSVFLVAAGRLEPPPDLGTWAPEALAGEVVLALADSGDAVLVGTRKGLYRMDGDGSVLDLGVPGPVLALAHDRGLTWVGTGRGLFSVRSAVPVPEPEPEPGSLSGVAIYALDARDGTVFTGSDAGVHRRTSSGGWEQLWSATDGGVDATVTAVMNTDLGVLFDHPEGLALRRADRSLDVVVRDVDVVALGRWPVPGGVWAGTRGEPLLLVSVDHGRTWQPRSEGLGLSAAHDLAAAPSAESPLVIGGSGLADGTGNAGTQRSDDGGRTWRTGQGRLTNTHVYALLAREEPVQLTIGIAGTTVHGALPLPTTTVRWYAGTNGSGVSTYRPDVPALDTAADAVPYLRIAEPILAGALLLAVLLPVYRRLSGRPGGRPRAPPTATTTAVAPPAAGVPTSVSSDEKHLQRGRT